MSAVQQSSACPAQFQFRVTSYHKTQKLHVQTKSSIRHCHAVRGTTAEQQSKILGIARNRKFSHSSG